MELINKIETLLRPWPIAFVRISIGIVFLWFGVLKFFPNTSPAETMAQRTMDKLTLGLISSEMNYLILAIIETVFGLFLIGNIFKKMIVPLTLGHLIMTFSPILLFPSEVFTGILIPTLLGQYIIKNLVLFSALLLINQRFCYSNSDEKICISQPSLD
ncbi:doxx family protein [Flagellimonas sp. S174]|uniref:doxx family protein n=1 Tax=Flagellimonas sp. S174 TaxID=3410790 RepID=UPI003BF4CE21